MILEKTVRWDFDPSLIIGANQRTSALLISNMFFGMKDLCITRNKKHQDGCRANCQTAPNLS